MTPSAEAVLDELEQVHAQAVASIEQYQTERAAALLDEAAELVANLPAALADSSRVEELRVRLVLTRSWTVAERDGPAAGRRVLDEATALARRLDRLDLVTLCLSQGASMLGRGGDLGGSLELMRLAEEGLDLLPEHDQARLLVNRGALASHLMQLDAARADLARAAEIAANAGAGTLEFMARHNQGYVEYLRGDLPAALALMDAADDMDVETSRTVAQLDRARVLLDAGLLSEASETLHEARELALAEGSEQDLGEIELDLARTSLLLGDAAGSAAMAGLARRRFRARAAGAWRRTALLVELEATGSGRDRPRETARLAAALGRAATDSGEPHLARRAALIEADACLELADPLGARAAYERAKELLTSGSLPTRLHLRLVGARLSEKPTRAAELLAAAADELALAQQRAASLDLRTALAVHSGRLATLDLDLGVRSGSVASLYTRSERWRAVSDRVPFVVPPHDARAAELLTQLRRVRADLREAPAEAQPQLRATAAALERRIRFLDWARSPQEQPQRLRPPRPLPYPSALAAVRAADVAVVSYLPHAGDLYAVVLTPRGGRIVRVAPLPTVAPLVRRVRADVEAAALPTGAAMRAAIDGSLTAGLAALDDAVFGAIRGQLGTGFPDRLVVVPNRTIEAVPWGMLPSRVGRSTTVARTVTAWAGSALAPPVTAPRVLAIAGPDLEHADSEVRGVGARWAAGGGTADVVESARAVRGRLARAMEECDLIHIAAHGRHQHQSPLFSTLRLADGAVFAHELPSVGIGASHVVLSACEVGRATIRAGDEHLGWAAVLLSLGVRSVVAPVSRIPDDVAAQAMLGYHANLAAGHDSPQALAMATADLPPIARAFCCLGGPWRAD